MAAIKAFLVFCFVPLISCGWKPAPQDMPGLYRYTHAFGEVT